MRARDLAPLFLAALFAACQTVPSRTDGTGSTAGQDPCTADAADCMRSCPMGMPRDEQSPNGCAGFCHEVYRACRKANATSQAISRCGEARSSCFAQCKDRPPDDAMGIEECTSQCSDQFGRCLDEMH